MDYKKEWRRSKDPVERAELFWATWIGYKEK